MSPNQKSSSSPQPSQPHWVRIGIIVLVLVFAFGGIIALIAGGGDDSDENDVTAGSSTSSTSTAVEPPKPCVAVADPLPAGAPQVPVQVGPAPTELVSQDLQEGTGATVNPGATVTVDYIGVSCSTGKIFDSSYSRGEPATFGLDEVIPGWGEGIPGMKVGGVRLLGIPPDQAYGPPGSPPLIGPNETLWFVVTVKETA